MARLLNAPICVPTVILSGQVTVVATYDNPSSIWNGYPTKYSVDVVAVAQTNSDENVPNQQYTLADIYVGMWFGMCCT